MRKNTKQLSRLQIIALLNALLENDSYLGQCQLLLR